MQENFSNENMNEMNTEQQAAPEKAVKNKSSKGWIAILISFLAICLIGGILVVTLIIVPAFNDLQDSLAKLPELLPSQSQEPQNPQQPWNPGVFIPDPETTPGQSEKPSSGNSGVSEELPELGGKAPIITNQINPVPEIAEALEECVVEIISYNTENVKTATEGSYGTGFIISENGYIVTNEHLVADGKKIFVRLTDEREFDAVIVGTDKYNDIAVLKIEATGIKAVPLGNSDSVRTGDLVVAIGNPLESELAGTVTVGYVSKANREINHEGKSLTMIQTDASVNYGNSGGPLISYKGEVIGMNTLKSIIAGYDDLGNPITAEGIGYAVPTNVLMPIVEKIITTGGYKRPAIGVMVMQITEEYAEEMNIPFGLVVDEVTKGGAAEKAGIRVDDVILKVDGKPATKSADITGLIREKGVGASIEIELWRKGKEITVTVEIGDSNKY